MISTTPPKKEKNDHGKALRIWCHQNQRTQPLSYIEDITMLANDRLSWHYCNNSMAQRVYLLSFWRCLLCGPTKNPTAAWLLILTRRTPTLRTSIRKPNVAVWIVPSAIVLMGYLVVSRHYNFCFPKCFEAPSSEVAHQSDRPIAFKPFSTWKTYGGRSDLTIFSSKTLQFPHFGSSLAIIMILNDLTILCSLHTLTRSSA